jgi:hypothetical protein
MVQGKEVIAVFNAPIICVEDGDKAGDILIKFYKSLGWNGVDWVDPCKVRVSQNVFVGLHDIMSGQYPEPVTIGMALVSKGPGVDDDLPHGKVRLLDGWTIPQNEKEDA